MDLSAIRAAGFLRPFFAPFFVNRPLCFAGFALNLRKLRRWAINDRYVPVLDLFPRQIDEISSAKEAEFTSVIRSSALYAFTLFEEQRYVLGILYLEEGSAITAGQNLLIIVCVQICAAARTD